MSFKGKIDQVPVLGAEEGYDAYAMKYLKDEPFLHEFDTKLLQRQIRSLAGETVLDVGCGTGRLAPLLHKRQVAQLIGIDISEKMLAQARKRGGYNELIHHMLPDELPFTWDTFDAILCSLVLVHIQERSLAFVCEEFFRVLKPGGTLYLTNLYQKRPPVLEAGDKKFVILSYLHRDGAILGHLEEAGFQILEEVNDSSVTLFIAQKPVVQI